MHEKPGVGLVYGFPLGDGGGLDRAVSATIAALNLAGYDVELVTFGTPDVESLRTLYGFDLRITKVHGDRLFYALPNILRLPFSTSVALYHTIRLSKRKRLLLFLGGRFQPTRFVAYRRRKAICYQISPRWRSTPEILAEKGSNLLRKAYRMLWDNSWPWPLGPCLDDLLVVHNSYAKKLLESEFGLKASYVLSLPSPEQPPAKGKRGKKVTHFGRFHPEKRHDAALEIMGLVHERVPEAEFVLMGMTNLDNAGGVLEALKSQIRSLGLGESVELVTNPPVSRVLEVLGESRVMMSMQLGPETYNMTIIESMSQGCIPVIPKVSGGAWEDILDNGAYGEGFGTAGEAADEIVRILQSSDDEFDKMSTRSLERAEFFSMDRFSARLDGILTEVLARRA